MKSLLALVFVVLFFGSAMAENNKTQFSWDVLTSGLQGEMGINVGYITTLAYLHKRGIEPVFNKFCKVKTQGQTIEDITHSLYLNMVNDGFLDVDNTPNSFRMGIIGGVVQVAYSLCRPDPITNSNSTEFAMLLNEMEQCKGIYDYTIIYQKLVNPMTDLALKQRILLITAIEGFNCNNSKK